MPVHFNSGDFERVAGKLEGFFSDFSDDLHTVGEIAASGIIQQTLGGIGEFDTPFAEYSDSYQRLLDYVGGKPQGTVNLRGVFLKDGQKNPKYRSNERRRLSGAGRQAYIDVYIGGKTFLAKTPVTRPALGLTDPRSEMSLDLIEIETAQHKLSLKYNPRSDDYMLLHQEGGGKLPQRKWFTLNRTAIKEAMHKALSESMRRRVERFNIPG